MADVIVNGTEHQNVSQVQMLNSEGEYAVFSEGDGTEPKTSLTLVDTATGTNYRICVTNGKLMMTEVTS